MCPAPGSCQVLDNLLGGEKAEIVRRQVRRRVRKPVESMLQRQDQRVVLRGKDHLGLGLNFRRLGLAV